MGFCKSFCLTQNQQITIKVPCRGKDSQRMVQIYDGLQKTFLDLLIRTAIVTSRNLSPQYNSVTLIH
jgi:hypothetical protein